LWGKFSAGASRRSFLLFAISRPWLSASLFAASTLSGGGRISMQSAYKAYKLTNKCSQCKCIGHNKQNHSQAVSAFIVKKNLGRFVDNATELAGAAQEDGWFDWMGD
jgi:hypothetical protein